MSKRGYAYWIEIVLSVIIVMVVFAGYLESSQRVFQYKGQQDLRETGWYVLDNLNKLGQLNTSNFTVVERYVSESLSDTTGFDLEYYNTTGCYPVDSGALGTLQTYCSSINSSTQNDVVSVLYTRNNNGVAESVRIYLWRKL